MIDPDIGTVVVVVNAKVEKRVLVSIQGRGGRREKGNNATKERSRIGERMSHQNRCKSMQISGNCCVNNRERK